MKNSELFSRPPPDEADFLRLFRHIWDMGIGNQMENGHPVPWTVGQMEIAFEEIQRPISIKSLENWRAGKSRPLPRNLVSLANIVSGGDPRMRDQWLEALSRAARDKEVPVQSVETKSLITEDVLNPPEPKTETVLSPEVSKRTIVGGGLAALILAGVAWIGGLNWAARSATSPIVTDIRFCTGANFNRETKQCLIDEPLFSASVDMIYVSFNAEPPYGTPFERRWYRDGVKFIQRDGFFDEAWENWTWINEDDGLLPGDYVMRIIIDGRTATDGFTIKSDKSEPKPL